MNRTLIALLLACFANSSMAADVSDLKGLKLLAPEADAIARGFKCSADMRTAERKCILPSDTIAGVTAFAAADVFDGTIHAIYYDIDSYQFDVVLAALREKYGAATCRTEQVQTRAGASYQNQVCIWRGAKSELRLDKYSGSINDSELVLSADDLAGLQQALKTKGAKKGAGDL